MNQEYLEILKDFDEFVQAVNSALQEQREYGKVSREAHKKVCDSFADVYAKQCVNHQLNDLQVMSIVEKIFEYQYLTGNSIDGGNILYKIAIEILNKNS